MKKYFYLSSLCTIMLLLVACSSIDVPSNVQIDSQNTPLNNAETAISSDSDAWNTLEALGSPTPKATTIPFEYLAKKNKADPFADTIFALDLSELDPPRFGVVYCNLPDKSIVKLWLRYQDANGDSQGEIQYASVQKGAVGFLFSLSPDTPKQEMVLEASLRTDDSEHPQPSELIALLGEHGEFMEGSQVVERELGGKYITHSWTIPWGEDIQFSKEGYVYLSRTAEKYHKKSCRFYRDGMLSVPKEIARMQGYGACSVCNP